VKRLFCMLAVVTLVLGASFMASAISIEGDASYLIGLGQDKGQGFAVHGKAELFNDIFADAAFSAISFKGAGDGEKGLSDTLFTVGGLYRVANEEDLQIFVGGGYAMLTHKHSGEDDESGSGVFGKFGFKLIPADKLSLVADVAYAPKFKLGAGSENLTTARATISYEVLENILVQGTIKHYRVSNSDVTSGILVGGGVSFTF